MTTTESRIQRNHHRACHKRLNMKIDQVYYKRFVCHSCLYNSRARLGENGRRNPVSALDPGESQNKPKLSVVDDPCWS